MKRSLIVPFFVAQNNAPAVADKNEKGKKMDEIDEVTEDLDLSEIQDGTFTANEDVDDETSDTEDKDEPDKKPDKKEDEPNPFGDEFKKLKDSYESASKHIEDLNKAVSSLRKENKDLKKGTEKTEEGVFSDAQLLAIMEENKDDPGVMLQAMKQLVKQGSIDIQKATDRKVEISTRRQDVEKATAPFKEFMGANKEAIDKIKEFAYLEDHPFAEHLALGALLVSQWPQFMNMAKEKAEKEALGDKVETARKKKINTGKPETPSESSKSGNEDGVNQSWVETANRLGFKGKKRSEYFKMMSKSSKKKEG